jgi:hypothetical protein
MSNSFGELFYAFFDIGFVGFANGVDGEFHFISKEFIIKDNVGYNLKLKRVFFTWVTTWVASCYVRFHLCN